MYINLFSFKTLATGFHWLHYMANGNIENKPREYSKNDKRYTA